MVAFYKTTSLPIKRMLIISIVLTICYAAFDEFHQGFTPNRTPYAGDVVIDTVGALFGAIFSLIYLKTRKS
ncbi:VanZ family protein [Salinibacillus xinjiangensis]|uniref:VanZ family protein n=1 Tax=Salinibacillus xinjiangensis TaxID=1229268 RepID=UPI002B2796E2|nr:VanZ family protein [Salinibacillus xinjiangensis]